MYILFIQKDLSTRIFNLLMSSNDLEFSNITYAELFLPMVSLLPSDFPRYRDCSIDDLDGTTYIQVLTHINETNKDQYKNEINTLLNNPHYVKHMPCEYASEYTIYYFKIPDHYNTDVTYLIENKPEFLSNEYKVMIKSKMPAHYTKLYTL